MIISSSSGDYLLSLLSLLLHIEKEHLNLAIKWKPNILSVAFKIKTWNTLRYFSLTSFISFIIVVYFAVLHKKKHLLLIKWKFQTSILKSKLYTQLFFSDINQSYSLLKIMRY